MRDILRELRELERQAEAVHDLFAGVTARAPGRVEGTDRTGAVRLVLDADGVPVEIAVAAGWQDVLAESGFGQAVRDAYGYAARLRMALWSQAITDADRPDRTGEPRDQRPPDGMTSRRPFADVLEDVLRDGAPVPTGPPPTATGTDRSGHLVLTLGPGALVSCEASVQWLSYQSGDALTAALAQALGAARAALAAAPPAERDTRLFDEVLAHMSDLHVLSES